MKYRKRPVAVEAVRWMGHGQTGERNIVGLCWEPVHDGYVTHTPHIHTLEGIMKVKPGDWIIRGVAGELYPCKPDIFEVTYEPAEDKP